MALKFLEYPNNFASALLGLFFVLLTPAGSLGQKLWNSHDPRFSDQAWATLESRTAEIEKELLQANGDEWAGKYHAGGFGWAESFSMSPNSGFTFTVFGCLGLYDLNYGRVLREDGVYRLSLAFPNPDPESRGVPRELVPVRWGGRHYLVPSDGFLEVVNAVNSGLEAQSRYYRRRFFLKSGDEKIAVSGFPVIPERFQSYLLKSPVEARIIGVQEAVFQNSNSKSPWETYTTRVVLNVGTADGVLEGMELHAYSPESILEPLVVVHTTEHTSEAEITEFYQLRKNKTAWRLSTNATSSL